MALAFSRERPRQATVVSIPSEPASPIVRAWDLLIDFASVSGEKGAIALGQVLATALLEAFSISLLVPLLGLAFDGGAQSERAGEGANVLLSLLKNEAPIQRLVLLLSLFVLLVSLRAMVSGMRDLSVVNLQVRFTSVLRLRLAERLAATSWDYITRLQHARVIQLMGADIQRLAIGVEFLLRSSAATVLLAAQFGLALVLAPLLALSIMLLLGLALIGFGRAMLHTRLLGTFALETNLALLNNTAQFLGGLKLAISQNLEDGFVQETSETLIQLGQRQNEFMRQQTRNRIAITVLAVLLGSGLLLVAYGWLRLPPAILLALSLLGTRMVGPVGQIQQGARQFAAVLPVYESLHALETELVESAASRYAPVDDYPEGPIVVRQVTYRHPGAVGEAKGLSGFSVTLTAGEFVGVIGASGAGKTTLADLLAGLYRPQEGEILVGGQRLEREVLASWRQQLSYISQDVFLFHDTIRRNLSWANRTADDEAMWRALAVSGADDFVRGLPNGIDTLVGERGTLISGGERQRIALARALLRSPRLLLMDEATNAIDSAGERIVLARLAALNPRPTILLITHHMENLDLCDRIVLVGEKRSGACDDEN